MTAARIILKRPVGDQPENPSLGRTIEIIEVRYRKKAPGRRNRRNSAGLECTPLPQK